MKTATIVIAVTLIVLEFVAFLVWLRHEHKEEE